MREKIRLIITVLLAVMLAGSIFSGLQTYNAKKAIELERNRLRDENEALGRNIEEISQERRQLEGKVNALTNDLGRVSQERQDIQRQYELLAREREDLVRKVETLQKDNEQLRAQLTNLTREKEKLGQRLEGDLAPLRDENAQLEEELDNLNTLKSKLEVELGQLKGEKSDLEGRLNEIDSFLKQNLSGSKYSRLKEQLDVIQRRPRPETQTKGPEKESIELPAIVVKPQTQAPLEIPQQPKSIPLSPKGTILEINRENNFVVIDLGQDAGIKPGDTLKVYREDKTIATLEVIQTRPSISACDIKEEIRPIEVGDIVK